MKNIQSKTYYNENTKIPCMTFAKSLFYLEKRALFFTRVDKKILLKVCIHQLTEVESLRILKLKSFTNY